MEKIICLPRHEEFGRVCKAKHNCARVFQPLDKRSVCLRNMSGAQLCAGLTTKARDFNGTLDADRNTVQWTAFPAGNDRLLRHARLMESALCIHLYEGIDLRIKVINPRQVSLNQFD